MTQLHYHDILWLLQRAPKNLLLELRQETCKSFIAGGFIRSCIAKEPISDIDIFSPDKDSAMKLCNALKSKKRDSHYIETENAITLLGYNYPIQFIHKWTFESPEECCKSFDFTIACAALFFNKKTKKWDSFCDENFYPDLAAKRLTYRSPIRNEEAGGSLLRVLKFYQKGYRIPLDSLGRVIARLVSKIEDHELYKKGTPDYEAWIGKVATGLLREVDPNTNNEVLAWYLAEGKDIDV